MIKLRLTGLPDELERFAAWLADQPGIEVLETSARYPNRGDSQYYRQYIEIDIEADAHQADCKVLRLWPAMTLVPDWVEAQTKLTEQQGKEVITK